MQITDSIWVDDRLIRERFVHSSGAGGQNVNKVASAVQLRFDLRACDTLSASVIGRLSLLANTRLNRRGEIVITANRHRSQQRNREEARERLCRLIQRALVEPVRRKPKRPPSAAAKRRRVDDKRRRSQTKSQRQRPTHD